MEPRNKTRSRRAKTAAVRGCRALVLLALLIAANVDAAGQDLIIVRADHVAVRLSVEIADTDAKRALGLMRRSSLAPRNGMLFDFERRTRIRMWMKNTLIPLDMLFVDNDGTIVHIARKTEPYSTELIEAPDPARYVLEINGGEARQLDIGTGDKLHLVAPFGG